MTSFPAVDAYNRLHQPQVVHVHHAFVSSTFLTQI